MAMEVSFGFLDLVVLANNGLNHTKEHEVLNLALFLVLLSSFFILADFLLFSFDPLLELGSLCHGIALHYFTLLLTLLWG